MMNGPAGVDDAAPTPHHHLTFHAAHPVRTRSGVSAAPGGAPPNLVLAGTRAKEAPMA